MLIVILSQLSIFVYFDLKSSNLQSNSPCILYLLIYLTTVVMLIFKVPQLIPDSFIEENILLERGLYCAVSIIL